MSQPSKSRSLRPNRSSRRGRRPNLAPRPLQLRGRGSFSADLADALRETAAVGLRKVGRAAGGAFGQHEMGRKAGGYISRILGFGAYGMPWSVSHNSMVSSDGQIPQVTSVRDKGVNIKHTEFIGFVPSSTEFKLTSYPIQPGNSTTFPWLASVAANFSDTSSMELYWCSSHL